MKKMLIALSISSVLVICYQILLHFIDILHTNGVIAAPGFLNLPLELPSLLFDSAPESIQYLFIANPFSLLLLKLLMFIFNVVLFAIPIFLILRFRSGKSIS